MNFAILSDRPAKRQKNKILFKNVNRRALIREVSCWENLEAILDKKTTNLLIIDWQHNEDNILKLNTLVSKYCFIRIILITENLPKKCAIKLFTNGIFAIIPHSLEDRQAAIILQLVALGGKYIPPEFLTLDHEIGQGKNFKISEPINRINHYPIENDFNKFASLSKRQTEIMSLLSIGSTNKYIARSFDISEGTVKTHIGAILKILCVPNRTAAASVYNARKKYLNNKNNISKTNFNQQTSHLLLQENFDSLTNLRNFSKLPSYLSITNLHHNFKKDYLSVSNDDFDLNYQTKKNQKLIFKKFNGVNLSDKPINNSNDVRSSKKSSVVSRLAIANAKKTLCSLSKPWKQNQALSSRTELVKEIDNNISIKSDNSLLTLKTYSKANKNFK